MNKKRHKKKVDNLISIYGINSGVEILKSKYQIQKIDLLNNGTATKNRNVMQLINSRNYKLRILDKEQYLKLYKGWRTQGIVVHFLGNILRHISNFESKKAPYCLLLIDGIEDPQNLGQIIRTCECSGINGILLPKNRSGEISQVTLQVSQGGFVHMPLYQIGNISQTIRSLKKQGFWVIGLENSINVKNWYSQKLTEKLVIVLGGEGHGIRHLTKKLCDHLVTIPMNGKINSLNVTAAASAILFERNRQILSLKDKKR